jgi:glycerol-3-phosphate dehydrogenase
MEGAAALAAIYQEDSPFLAPKDVDRIVKAYGTRARFWLNDAHSRSDLGEDFGCGLSAAEVDYLVAHEWAVTAEDILWRRSKMGLLFNATQVAALSEYLSQKVAAT